MHETLLFVVLASSRKFLPLIEHHVHRLVLGLFSAAHWSPALWPIGWSFTSFCEKPFRRLTTIPSDGFANRSCGS